MPFSIYGFYAVYSVLALAVYGHTVTCSCVCVRVRQQYGRVQRDLQLRKKLKVFVK